MTAPRRVAAAALIALFATTALAQPAPRPPSIGPTPRAVAQEVRTPALPAYQRLSDADVQTFRDALRQARASQPEAAISTASSIRNPTARKLILWAAIDVAGDRLSFVQLDAARRELWGWPRQANRQAAAERALAARSGLSPAGIAQWFGGDQPATAEGTMALASAWQATGRSAEAATLIRGWWRDRSFDASVQTTMLARFGAVLTQDDHVKRADLLLYGPQGPAAQQLISLLPADYQALSRARMQLRSGATNPGAAASSVPADLRDHAGLAYESARYYRERNMESQAFPLLSRFPSAPGQNDSDERVWEERRRLMNAAIRSGNWRAAYTAVANSELLDPADLSDAEFFAGWLALRKLNDNAAAERHFQRVRSVARSPVTSGRAWYWLGRTAEARGDQAEAQRRYAEGARWWTSFYGQLSMEKAGITELVLPEEPTPTAADRARFDGRELVQAARILAESGERELFRVFVLHADDTLPTAEEAALLVDLSRQYQDQFTSMLVVRAVAQRGFIMPGRGYPMRTPPFVAAAPETPFVLGLTRQESGFDAAIGSGAGARGMMQLMPATAQLVARQMGESYSLSRLSDPDYNMRLGQTYLSRVLQRFDGSYIMAAAGYNAGPGRPSQWAAFCGDPRQGADPLDFIECIPFTETRDYVMRVLDGTQVYRAKLNGGRAQLMLSRDLRRGSARNSADVPAPRTAGGSYSATRTDPVSSPYNPSPRQPIASRPVPNPPAAPVTSTPVPNPPEGGAER